MPKPQLCSLGEILQLDLEPGVEYRSIPPYRNYAIGDDGSVWTRKTVGPQINFQPWKRLRFYEDWETKPGNLPYLRVSLSDGKGYWYRVHLVVLAIFRGPRPEGMVARHLNGNCQDNRLLNLAWGTRQQNKVDQLEHGRALRGARTNRTPLTEDDVRRIRTLRGVSTARDIASHYGVGRGCIYGIWQRQRWWYVE